MRVTENGKLFSLQRQLAASQERVQVAVEQVASGNKYQRASDNPVAASRVERIANIGSRQEAYLSAGATMRAELEQADGTLGNAYELLVQARELALQYTSPAVSTDLFAAGAERVQSLQDGLVTIANARFGDGYLFGGVADNRPPYQADGTFVGTDRTRSVAVQDGTEIGQVSAAQVFAGTGGGLDIMATLGALRTALEAGDRDAVRALLPDLETAHGQVDRARQSVGYRLDVVEQAANFSSSLLENLAQQRSAVSDTDIVGAASELSVAQTSLQAVAQVTASRNSIDILRLLSR